MSASSAHANTLSINDRALTAHDGTRIAYRVEGTGPALVLTNGLTTTTMFWKYVRPIWLQQHTIVTWDLPGHGNSGPALSAETASVPGQPALIAQVMKAAGIERAVQIGWSTGSQVVLELYRQHPALCESLVVVLGGAGHALDNTRLPMKGSVIDWLATHLPPPVFEATVRLLQSSFRTPAALLMGRQVGLIGRLVSEADAAEMTAHIASVHPGTLQGLLHSFQVHSAQDLLATLAVPLLIVAGDVDPFAPTDLVGLPLQRSAPGSELLRLPRGTHTALLEESYLIAAQVQRFIAAHAA